MSLNPDKTETIVIGTRARRRAEGTIASLTIGGVIVHTTTATTFAASASPSTIVCLSTTTSRQRLQIVLLPGTRTAIHIRKHVEIDTAKSIASILHGTAAFRIQKLQRVQNTLARVISSTRRPQYIKPILAKLHWLLITYRIQYKLALITFKILTSQEP